MFAWWGSKVRRRWFIFLPSFPCVSDIRVVSTFLLLLPFVFRISVVIFTFLPCFPFCAVGILSVVLFTFLPLFSFVCGRDLRGYFYFSFVLSVVFFYFPSPPFLRVRWDIRGYFTFLPLFSFVLGRHIRGCFPFPSPLFLRVRSAYPWLFSLSFPSFPSCSVGISVVVFTFLPLFSFVFELILL